MADTIVSAKYVDDRDWDKKGPHTGFQISTAKQEIYMMMDSRQICCESSSLEYYFVLGDGKIYEADGCFFEQMEKLLVGQEIASIRWGFDKDLPPSYANKNPNISSGEEGDDWIFGVAFVELKTTNNAKLQLIAQNWHNGYYHHNVHVQWMKDGKLFQDCQEI